MKRKKVTRVKAGIMAGALLCSALVGCGNASEDKTTTKESTANSVESTVAAEESKSASTNSNLNETGLPILNEKETFTIAVPEMSPIKAAAEKQCVIDTEKATNVHIEWIEIPQSGWTEKINIMFSTDGLPDAIIGGVDMAKYYDQFVALDDYMATYAPVTNAYFETRDDYPEGILAVDGKLHYLPAGDEVVKNMLDAQYWINTGWLEKLNLKMPTTTEELREVLIAFRDNDPNGNGQKDEIPFTFKDAWGWANSIKNLFGPFGVVENDSHVFTKDGKVTFSAGEKGYYDALAWMHELYAEGLIDQEAFTLSDDMYSSRGAVGDVIGVMAGYNAVACGSDNGDGSLYQPLPALKGPDGTQMVGMNSLTRDSGFAISKKCKNPEALIRWYDYINSSMEIAAEWGRGPRGVMWDVAEVDGVEVPKLLTVTPEVLAANGGYKTQQEFRNAESFSGQSPTLWRKEYAENAVYDENAKYDYKLNSVIEQQQYGVQSLPVGSATAENSDRRKILIADIDNYLEKFIADSIINGIDDAKWSEHLENLKKLKVDEYTSLCQEFVDSLK